MTASLLAYGSENHHQEMRKRIASDMSEHEDFYLDDSFMKRGIHPGENQSVARNITSYSVTWEIGLTKRMSEVVPGRNWVYF